MLVLLNLAPKRTLNCSLVLVYRSQKSPYMLVLNPLVFTHKSVGEWRERNVSGSRLGCECLEDCLPFVQPAWQVSGHRSFTMFRSQPLIATNSPQDFALWYALILLSIDGGIYASAS